MIIYNNFNILFLLFFFLLYIKIVWQIFIHSFYVQVEFLNCKFRLIKKKVRQEKMLRLSVHVSHRFVCKFGLLNARTLPHCFATIFILNKNNKLNISRVCSLVFHSLLSLVPCTLSIIFSFFFVCLLYSVPFNILLFLTKVFQF